MKFTRILFGVIAGIVALAIVGNALKNRRKVETPSSVLLPESLKAPSLASLSPEQRERLEEFARKVAAAVNESDSVWLGGRVATDKLLERVMHGFTFPSEKVKKQFLEGAARGLSGEKRGLFGSMVGGRVKYLRLQDVDGQGTALLRVQMPGGAVGFAHMLPDFSGPDVKAADMFHTASGTFASENMRDLMIPVFTALNQSGGGKLDGLEKLMKFQQSGDMEGVITAFRGLAPEFQRRAVMRQMYLAALMSREDTAEYEKELVRIQRDEPDDVATTFKLFDLYFLKKEWAQAAAAAKRVDEELGGDAWLGAMQGMCLAYDGKLEESAAVFAAAEKLDPELQDVLIFKIHLHCAGEDYAAAVVTLKELQKRFDAEPDFNYLRGEFPAVKTFMESDDYKAWRAES